MDLHLSLTSPFARNVRIAVIELGLTDRIRQIVVDPWTDASFRSVNPLSKVPALVTGDGTVMIDSPVIVDYLDHLASGSLFEDRWRTLRLQAIANGITEAAVRIVIERRRAAAEQSSSAIARQWDAINASLDLVERERAPLGTQMGDIALGVALGYLDFRFAGFDWRGSHPFLAECAAASAERPSFRATTPPS